MRRIDMCSVERVGHITHFLEPPLLRCCHRPDQATHVRVAKLLPPLQQFAQRALQFPSRKAPLQTVPSTDCRLASRLSLFSPLINRRVITQLLTESSSGYYCIFRELELV